MSEPITPEQRAGCFKTAGSDVPPGWELTSVQVYRKGYELVLVGTPKDDAHNCDAMGCGSVHHVVARARVTHE